MIEEKRSQGLNPFPHKFQVSISLKEFLSKYDYLEKDKVLEDLEESVAGMIFRKLWVLVRASYFL